MSTKPSTVEFILDQLKTLQDVTTRKMFGEYALYCDGKVVGLVCDDTLFIKITDEGKKFVGTYYKEGHAYKGAKPSMVIDGDKIEDHRWLVELVDITVRSLPPLTPKKFIK